MAFSNIVIIIEDYKIKIYLQLKRIQPFKRGLSIIKQTLHNVYCDTMFVFGYKLSTSTIIVSLVNVNAMFFETCEELNYCHDFSDIVLWL